jgi:hypothetical protein
LPEPIGATDDHEGQLLVELTVLVGHMIADTASAGSIRCLANAGAALSRKLAFV